MSLPRQPVPRKSASARNCPVLPIMVRAAGATSVPGAGPRKPRARRGLRALEWPGPLTAPAATRRDREQWQLGLRRRRRQRERERRPGLRLGAGGGQDAEAAELSLDAEPQRRVAGG